MSNLLHKYIIKTDDDDYYYVLEFNDSTYPNTFAIEIDNFDAKKHNKYNFDIINKDINYIEEIDGNVYNSDLFLKFMILNTLPIEYKNIIRKNYKKNKWWLLDQLLLTSNIKHDTALEIPEKYRDNAECIFNIDNNIVFRVDINLTKVFIYSIDPLFINKYYDLLIENEMRKIDIITTVYYDRNEHINELNNEITKLNNKIDKLKTKIKYSPGNIGYLEAKESFDNTLDK